MVTIKKEMMIEMAHRLPSHKGLCQFIHGHSYKFVVHAATVLRKENGMVADFKELKELMNEVIGSWDHALILDCEDPAFEEMLEKDYCRVLAFPGEPTAENMAEYLGERFNHLLKGKDADYFIVQVDVWETVSSCASWSIYEEEED